MRHGAKVVAGLAIVLSGCGHKQNQTETVVASNDAAPAAETGPVQKPPVAFTQCMACHSVEPGRTLIGPSLHGVVGRKAASLPGYTYSDALKASGLTWNEATLDKWITKPAEMVPGSKMTYFGMADPAQRKEVIDYLAAQK